VNPQLLWHFVGSVPENYERYLVPSIFAPWADDLVEVAELDPGHRVLDIACGTGIVARTAARRLGSAGRVVGLDLSPPMLAVARVAAAAEGVTIEWREGSALQLPSADREFDVVFCQQGLQFFPDRPAALREMRRVLAPSGRIVLSVWRPIEQSPGFAVLAQALTTHISPEAGTLMTCGPFGLSSTEELRRLITAAFAQPRRFSAIRRPTNLCSAMRQGRRLPAPSPMRTPTPGPRCSPRWARNCSL
jgi:ubiquinone/menaquinone biosynthesis C-methylase UbiE